MLRAIQMIIDKSGAKVGVAATRFAGDTTDGIRIKGTAHFPMQSVYKFPLALAVLDQVREGRLKLDQLVHIRRSDLDSDTWSPMYKAKTEAEYDIKLSMLVRYMISQSDNNACDVLFRLIGGPKAARRYLKKNGVKNIRMVATEHQMHQKWKAQYRNWATPLATQELLLRFNNGEFLNKELNTFLYAAMVKSLNSPDRIGGQLPDVVYSLAHKTGSSGTNDAGITAAVNDVGILSYEKHKLAIVVFVSDFKGDTKKGERVIAQISRLIWDYYMPETKNF